MDFRQLEVLKIASEMLRLPPFNADSIEIASRTGLDPAETAMIVEELADGGYVIAEESSGPVWTIIKITPRGRAVLKGE
jgi:hypothetical protein